MLRLRADPWMPEYGMGFDVRFDEPPQDVDPFVETEDWGRPRAARPAERAPIWFIDGVRRVDLRLLADDDGRRVPGLFGTYAVGCARCDGRAEFRDHEIGRALVLGGGARADRAEVACGTELLRYEPHPTPGTEPDDPLLKLQQLMREAEGNLAARIAAGREGLVAADGPLAFFGVTDAPVVGVVKRFGRVYLEEEQSALIPKLAPGERTPLFGIAEEGYRRHRYAWYARVAVLVGPWHDHAGVVRCEVRAGIGVEAAAEVADRLSALLPAYAGRASDPRTPQNLVPIATLESWLRHRAGDARLVRRALLAHLSNQAAAA